MTDSVKVRVSRSSDEPSPNAELARAIMKDLSDHINSPMSPIPDGDVLAFESGVKYALSRLEFRLKQ